MVRGETPAFGRLRPSRARVEGREEKMTDPIADMLTRLRNAVIAKHSRVDVPASKLKLAIARILEDEGYIQGFKIVDEKSPAAAKAVAPRQLIRILLKYGPRGER